MIVAGTWWKLTALRGWAVKENGMDSETESPSKSVTAISGRGLKDIKEYLEWMSLLMRKYGEATLDECIEVIIVEQEYRQEEGRF